jgi:hypothetical protein
MIIKTKKLITAIWKHKLMFIILSIAFLAIGVGTVHLINANVKQAQIRIALSYPGIEKGLNPDGSRFDVSQIKEPEIIGNIIEKGTLPDKLQLTDIRSMIEISPLVPAGMSERIEAARKAGTEFIYYPNEFSINLDFNTSMTQKQGFSLLEGIVDEYAKYFFNLFSEQGILVSSINGIDYTEYDYPEMSYVIGKKLDIINNYLEEKREETRDFRSPTKNITYSDLLSTVTVLRDIDLKSLESIIESYSLSKDKEMLINLYEHRIKKLELQRDKKKAEAAILAGMMDIFDHEKSVVLVAGVEDKEFKPTDGTSYYDRLAENSIDASVISTDNDYQIEYYQELIEEYKKDESAKNQKQVALDDINGILSNIDTKVNDIIVKAETITTEYYTQKIGNAIEKISNPSLIKNTNEKLIYLIALFLGFTLATIITIEKEFIKPKNKKRGVK